MSELNSSVIEPVAHNTYFEGKVQSLGLATAAGKATVGVMKKGTYTFSTSSPEKMIVIAGQLHLKLADGSFKIYEEQGEFDVAANTSFEVMCDADVAYLCYYA
ncbi:pyrimidine/purine nucleoside phosphorylase [Pedobacter sp. MC2016-14]|uniref:pyrimidine/purine nucleoside phosphorylase n=1 Tax=Pedobacter sp. MC2016-14 TaxID=2897327 RepID=UPI001E30F870|nr:pyrimidine/purine nucleoside phosphorylase [Pedobacter sp. MC2016-14]MCD0487881.1 pyrimidine/purine nucleoside phosphorylase [Pedobacter sp. MC2016-14]